MDALILVTLAGLALVLAYLTYGRWLARLFTLREDSTTPAVSLRDDRDYCPTRRSIVFGHHFTSIAGTGPIVGPAIAVMWGWLPAILWVVLGSIFLGAVHDLGSVVVSLRNKGRSVGDIAGDLLGPRVRFIFLALLIVGLWIVLAVFGLVIAAVLRQYPGAIFPVLVQVPIALTIGAFFHRAGRSIFLPSVIALALMYLSVVYGDVGVLHTINQWLAAQPTWAWTVGLLLYAYIASVLPVWRLLQPRDYINSLQLLSALGLLLAGLVCAAFLGGRADAGLSMEAARTAGLLGERIPLEIVAPTVDLDPAGAPPMFPILFITIACGAISGFHCLVASGTTSKQLLRETDARAVGYGAMLTEGFLATLVIAACAAGIGLGVTKSVRDTGSTGFSPSLRDWSYVSGSLFEVNLPHCTYGMLSEFRSPDVRQVAPNPYDPNNGSRRIELQQGPAGLRIVSWGATLPTMEYQKASSRERIFWSDLGVGYRNIDRYGEIRLGRRGERDWEFLPSMRIAERTDADLTSPIHVPEGSFRADETGRNITLTGRLAFHKQYESWSSAGSLGNMVGSFVDGAANLIASLGLPLSFGAALMGVFVASFAGTTMDTACRLQRYVLQELSRTFLPGRSGPACKSCGYDLRGHPKAAEFTRDNAERGGGLPDFACPECGERERIVYHGEHDAVWKAASPANPFKWLATTHGATLFAVVTAAILAATPAPGQTWSLASAGSGGLMLWPLFGATNQLLAGLAFLVIYAWLRSTKRPTWFVVGPMLLMLCLPAAALVWQAFIGNDATPSWLESRNWVLVTVAGAALALEAVLIVEAARGLRRGRVVEA